MNSSFEILENSINKFTYNDLIFASDYYKQFSTVMTEDAYYKSLERLEKSEKIVRLTRGIYCRNKHTQYGNISLFDDDICNYFVNKKKAIIVGNKLYNNLGLTTQISKKVELLSSSIKESRLNITNVTIEQISSNFTSKYKPYLEIMDVLQNFSKIEDINLKIFTNIVETFINSYINEEMIFVVKNKKYKKSTIAFMKNILDKYDINNTLDDFLSSLSSYKIPIWED